MASQSIANPKSDWRPRALLVVKGACMGAADVVPGVSGGTMAFILGIYAQLLAAIKSFDLAWLRALLRLDLRTGATRPHFGFLIPLGLGIVAALLFFTRVVPLPRLILAYPEEIYGLFFGLIAGSIAVLLRELQGLRFTELLWLLAGLASGLFVFNLVPAQTPDASWFIFLAGALAICAMILPGVSGSFVLLILNKYAYVFDAIGYFKLSVLIPFAAGAGAGLICFSRLLSSLLRRRYRPTMLCITGILLASLWVIWPFQRRAGTDSHEGLLRANPVLPAELSQTVLLSGALMLLGASFVLTINRFKQARSQGGQVAD